MIVGVIAGFVLLALGVGLVVLGVTFEEPAQRLATRSVPTLAPVALSVAGGGVGLGGLVMIVRGLRARR